MLIKERRLLAKADYIKLFITTTVYTINNTRIKHYHDYFSDAQICHHINPQSPTFSFQPHPVLTPIQTSDNSSFHSRQVPPKGLSRARDLWNAIQCIVINRRDHHVHRLRKFPEHHPSICTSLSDYHRRYLPLSSVCHRKCS